MHAASGHRLGAAHPRQELPGDLRLVPPAAAAWAAAAWALGASARVTAGWVVCCLLAAGALLVRGRRPVGGARPERPVAVAFAVVLLLSLIHISQPTREAVISHAASCLSKNNNSHLTTSHLH